MIDQRITRRSLATPTQRYIGLLVFTSVLLVTGVVGHIETIDVLVFTSSECHAYEVIEY